MTTMHEDKSSGKPRQRNRKAGQRARKAGQQENPKPDQRDGDQVDAMSASSDIAGSETVPPVAQPSIGKAKPVDMAGSEEVKAADISPTEATAPVGENPPVDMQTIANAYRDYTQKSVQQNSSFVEKLMGARSFDKAVEVQADYAKQAYENFVAESQKICGLYSRLAGQAFKRGRRQA
jgi:hypothetical protein